MTNWNAFYKMIIKKIWVVILIPFFFVSLTTYITLYMIKPLYQATTTLAVMINHKTISNEITYDDLLANQLLVKNYKDFIKSRAVISEVIRDLKLSSMTEQELAEIISVELVPDSSLINILVRHEDYLLAGEIANEVSYVFIKKSYELLKVNNIILVDKANVGEKPVYPRSNLMIAFSFVMGFFLSLGLILVMVYRDDTIGGPEEIRQKTGLHVVGIIPFVKQVEAKRDACKQANGSIAKQAAQLQKDLLQKDREIKDLHRELKRKEAALAETATLLVLRKKAQATLGDLGEE